MTDLFNGSLVNVNINFFMMALSSWNTGRSIPGVMPHPPGCPIADIHFSLLKKCICVLECLSYVEVLSPAFWVWPHLEIRSCRCNKVRLRSQWIREGPNAVTGVLTRGDLTTQTQRDEATWWWKQRVEWCGHKPRAPGTGSRHQKPEVPGRTLSQCLQRGAWLWEHVHS